MLRPACPAVPPQNVPTIVPVLEKEYRNASRRLEETQVELNDLHPEKLKVRGPMGCSLLRHAGRARPQWVAGMQVVTCSRTWVWDSCAGCCGVSGALQLCSSR